MANQTCLQQTGAMVIQFITSLLAASVYPTSAAEVSIGSVYSRYASLRDQGHRELNCKMEATFKHYQIKSLSTSGLENKPEKSDAPLTAASANALLKGVTFAFAMRAGECEVAETVAPGDAPSKRVVALARTVAELTQTQCAKLSLYYFRNPLSDYARDTKLSAQAGYYRIAFASGDYKLTAFLSPELRVLREYSDGKENQTDIVFKQEGEKLAPAKISVKALGGKSMRIDALSYEIKKGLPILSGFRSTIEDVEFKQESAIKLSVCKLVSSST